MACWVRVREGAIISRQLRDQIAGHAFPKEDAECGDPVFSTVFDINSSNEIRTVPKSWMLAATGWLGQLMLVDDSWECILVPMSDWCWAVCTIGRPRRCPNQERALNDFISRPFQVRSNETKATASHSLDDSLSAISNKFGDKSRATLASL